MNLYVKYGGFTDTCVIKKNKIRKRAVNSGSLKLVCCVTNISYFNPLKETDKRALKGFLQHDLCLMLAVHSMFSLSWYPSYPLYSAKYLKLAVHMRQLVIWGLWYSVSACLYRYNSWLKRQQKWLMACKIIHCISACISGKIQSDICEMTKCVA